jgi:hypothetical protein
MGKVILEFDSVEEQEDIRNAIDGYKYKIAIAELDHKLRNHIKNAFSILDNNKEITDIEYEILEKIRNEIREILIDNNLSID